MVTAVILVVAVLVMAVVVSKAAEAMSDPAHEAKMDAMLFEVLAERAKSPEELEAALMLHAELERDHRDY